jgi:hypothetical protein
MFFYWLNVLVHVEKVVGVIFGFYSRQPLIIVTKAGVPEFLIALTETGEIHVDAAI